MHYVQHHTKRMIRHHLTCCWIALGSIACGGRSPTPVITNGPANSATIPKDGIERKRTFPLQIYEPGELHYDVQIKSVLEPVLGDSIHRRDSTQTSSIIQVRFAHTNVDGEVLAIARVDSTILRSIDNTPVQLPAGVFTFHINPKTRQISADQRIDCSDTTIASDLPIHGLEILPIITPSDAEYWVDTSQVQICRGSITLSLTRIATYTVIDRGPAPIQILRTSTMTISGSGYQWNQRVVVSGQGSATDTLLVDESRLQRINANARLEVVFNSPLRHQEYVQVTSTLIRLRR